MKTFSILLLLSFLPSQQGPSDSPRKGKDPLQTLLGLYRKAQQEQAEENENIRRESGLRVDPWHCIGPFKEGSFGNVLETFEKVYPPEADLLSAKGGQVCSVENFKCSALVRIALLVP